MNIGTIDKSMKHMLRELLSESDYRAFFDIDQLEDIDTDNAHTENADELLDEAIRVDLPALIQQFDGNVKVDDVKDEKKVKKEKPATVKVEDKQHKVVVEKKAAEHVVKTVPTETVGTIVDEKLLPKVQMKQEEKPAKVHEVHKEKPVKVQEVHKEEHAKPQPSPTHTRSNGADADVFSETFDKIVC
jgi:hypothetical protein